MTRRRTFRPPLASMAAAALATAALAAYLAAWLVLPGEAGAAYPGENGRIVFESFREWDPPSSLYSADPETGTLTRLTDNDGTVVRDRSPAVSPDGTRVAFFRTDERSYWTLYAVDADGTGLEKVADAPSPSFSPGGPTWSPDGRKIAFSAKPRYQGRDSEVYVVDADGTDLRKVTDDALNEAGLA